MLENHSVVFGGHFLSNKLIQKVSQCDYWPGMKADVYQVCNSCVTGLSTQGHERYSRSPLQCIDVDEPFEGIKMDSKEFDIGSMGNKYALVFQDYFMKWPEIYQIADYKAHTVADCLADMIWRYGVPSCIIRDWVPKFLSDVPQDTADIFGL